MQNNKYIYYGSQTGNAKEISKQIYETLTEKKYNCKNISLNETIENDTFTFIKNEEFCTIIIICSTTGNGDCPETANIFYQKIKNRKQSKIF
jgi:flavodoxin